MCSPAKQPRGIVQATNGPAEAEPLYRRMLFIFLQSAGGVPGVHAYARAGVTNYAAACREMGLVEDVFLPRLLGIFHEAGVSEEKRDELLGAVFG